MDTQLPFRILLTCGLATAASALLHAGEPPFHQPPQPPEAGAGRSWAEKYEERKRQWCFQPVTHPAALDVKDLGWANHPLDRFILARLESAGLKPSPRAGSEVLARRLAFALTGLPPDDDAARLPLEVQLDRLLASPAFGEHWARHWMDVVRYAETFGSEHDYLSPHAWRYRDYLVRAFNDDVPYDRFIHEQLAGDLMKEPRMNAALGINESLLGTAFQRMTEFYATPVDTKREEATVLDWQIENVTKAFLGLTVSCARCHDHKFDPISTADFYALYGIFTGARPVLNIIDDPIKLTRHDATLTKLKLEMRKELAGLWLNAPLDGEALHRAMSSAKENTVLSRWRAALGTGRLGPEHTASIMPEELALRHWKHSGPGLPSGALPAGTLSVHAQGRAVVRAVQPSGYFSDAISERHGGSLRSPEFILTKRNLSVLAGGTGKARLRLVVDGCQGDILLFGQANKGLEDATPRWHTMRLREQWLGHRAHLELITRDDIPTVGNVKSAVSWSRTDGRSSFGVIDVALHDDGEKLPALALPERLWQTSRVTWAAYAAEVTWAVRHAVTSWMEGELTDAQANLLQAMLEGGLLPNQAAAGSALERLMTEYRKVEAMIPVATRAPGVQDDGSAHDSPVFVRGDHLTPGEVVPRRMLSVLGGRPLTGSGKGDRLTLAQEITRRDNPLTARVMVNRIWHHLFGRGLVATADNLGKMGDKPTHPELLDHLSTKFMADGWSVKSLIRYLVTSRTWQAGSVPSPEAVVKDPGNLLLSHAHVRRLQAESIRDAMLAVTGNFDRGQGGPSVHAYYRTVTDPDKQPPAGAIDGLGRRSIYIEVRRNFLSEFMTTFDFPRPNIPTGVRSQTNVPGQSITLLNDPFVLRQAAKWAVRVEALPVSNEERIVQMYRDAFGRAATGEEVARALDFVQTRSLVPVAKPTAGLHQRAPLSAWIELAHAMFNMKEFIYLP